MPRQPRYFIRDLPQHVIQRGVNRQQVFFASEDYKSYLATLRNAAAKYKCDVHAYVLMTNHVHLLLTPRQKRSIPLVMQAIGRGYVQNLNKRYSRTGTLWEGRYRASLVQSERYALACYRYIELNPVRAEMVRHPAEYPHSSYRCNALGNADPVVKPHSVYTSISRCTEERRRLYRALVEEGIGADLTDVIRQRTNACRILGSDRFVEQVETLLGRSLRPGKIGRPRNSNGLRQARDAIKTGSTP